MGHAIIYGLVSTSSTADFDEQYVSKSQIFTSSTTVGGGGYSYASTRVSNSYDRGSPIINLSSATNKRTTAMQYNDEDDYGVTAQAGGETEVQDSVSRREGNTFSFSRDKETKASNSYQAFDEGRFEGRSDTYQRAFGGTTKNTESGYGNLTESVYIGENGYTQTRTNSDLRTTYGTGDGGALATGSRKVIGGGQTEYKAFFTNKTINGTRAYTTKTLMNINSTQRTNGANGNTDSDGDSPPDNPVTYSDTYQNTDAGQDQGADQNTYEPSTFATTFKDAGDVTTLRTRRARKSNTVTTSYFITRIPITSEDPDTSTEYSTISGVRTMKGDGSNIDQNYPFMSETSSEGVLDPFENTFPTIELQTWSAYGPMGFVTVSKSDTQTLAITAMPQIVKRTLGLKAATQVYQMEGSTTDPEEDIKRYGFRTTDDYVSSRDIITTVEGTSSYSGLTRIGGDFSNPTTLSNTSATYSIVSTTVYTVDRNNSFFINGQDTTIDIPTRNLRGSFRSYFETEETLVFFDQELYTKIVTTYDSVRVYTESSRGLTFRRIGEGQVFNETVKTTYIDSSNLKYGPIERQATVGLYTGAENMFRAIGSTQAAEVAYVYETDDRLFDKNYPPEVTTFDTTYVGSGSNRVSTSTNSGRILMNLGGIRTAIDEYNRKGSISLLFTDTTLKFSNIKQSGTSGRIGKTAFGIVNSGAEVDKLFTHVTMFGSKAGSKGDGFAEQEIFAGGRNNATFDGFFSAIGPGLIKIGSETIELSQDEIFTKGLNSSDKYVIKNKVVLLGTTKQDAIGFMTSNLDNYSPFVTGYYY